jgi:PhoPQ-activated pathogenicity-related protein
VIHEKAMFFVSGGYNKDSEGKESFTRSKELLDFSNMAFTNKATIVVLEDVPNQYLLMNSSYKKEEQILAYTYTKVMQDPMKNAYLSGHLPMVKSIIKGMDAGQEILAKNNINIVNFIMVGISKRGWASWLASLEDNRVSAIIPIGIDILNVQKNIKHICRSYKNQCPPALKDYEAEGITPLLDSQEFQDLMKIDDPLQYMGLDEYKKQSHMPRYIINNSGDDFFVPDSSKFYFKHLPGENHIRYLANSMHYYRGNPISEALDNMKLLNEAVNNYFYFYLNNVNLPNTSWKILENKITINSSVKPSKVKLWTAHNKNSRDFRCLNDYSNTHVWLKVAKINLAKYLPISIDICDTPYKEKEVPTSCSDNGECIIDVNLPNSGEGWHSSFVELHYNINSLNFVITTEDIILPDIYP